MTDAVRAALVELVRLADTVEKAHNPTWDAAWNAARAALSEQPATPTTPNAALPPLGDGPRKKISVTVEVPENWEKRLDMQWVLEREIHADRWSWNWPKLRDGRPSLWVMQAREVLQLISTPMRPDGTWNRDREACRQLAAEALGRYDDDTQQWLPIKTAPNGIGDDDVQS